MGGFAEGTQRKRGGRKIRRGGNWSGDQEDPRWAKKIHPTGLGGGNFEKPLELYCRKSRDFLILTVSATTGLLIQS